MTILLGNLLVNMSFFALSTLLIFEVEKAYSAGAGFALSVVFLVLVLVFGEIVPKTLASIYPYGFSKFVAPPLLRLLLFMRPVTYVLESVVAGINRLMGVHKEEVTHIDESHLQELVDVSEQFGALGEIDADVLEKLIHFSDIKVKEVYLPRVDVHSCKFSSSLNEVLLKASEWGVSTVPLYKEHHDDIEYFINIRDALSIDDLDQPVSRLAKPVFCISEYSTMDFVLREFLQDELELALVVDEYGHMSGLITWIDVMNLLNVEMEQIFSSNAEHGPIKILSGRSRLRELELDENEDREQVTVNGWITSEIGRIPKKGEEVLMPGYRVLVMKSNDKSIEEVICLPLVQKKKKEES